MPGERQKSPSERLRAMLFIYWEQRLKDRYPDFEKYYMLQIDKIIEQFKNKLNN